MITQSLIPPANTFTQLYIQTVFGVQNRASLIRSEWEDQLYKYITGIIRNNGHKMLAINGIEDHVHVFFGLNPSQSISDLMRLVKGDSSKWINQNKFVSGRFSWQSGYGAFSYSRNRLDQVCQYIQNQKEHHKTIRFVDEYVRMLEEFEIAYDSRYIFKQI